MTKDTDQPQDSGSNPSPESDFTDLSVDELLSAYLDGEANQQDRDLVENNPAWLSRLAQFQEVNRLVAAPCFEAQRDEIISVALGEYSQLFEPSSQAAGPLESAKSSATASASKKTPNLLADDDDVLVAPRGLRTLGTTVGRRRASMIGFGSLALLASGFLALAIVLFVNENQNDGGTETASVVATGPELENNSTAAAATGPELQDDSTTAAATEPELEDGPPTAAAATAESADPNQAASVLDAAAPQPETEGQSPAATTAPAAREAEEALSVVPQSEDLSATAPAPRDAEELPSVVPAPAAETEAAQADSPPPPNPEPFPAAAPPSPGIQAFQEDEAGQLPAVDSLEAAIEPELQSGEPAADGAVACEEPCCPETDDTAQDSDGPGQAGNPATDATTPTEATTTTSQASTTTSPDSERDSPSGAETAGPLAEATDCP